MGGTGQLGGKMFPMQVSTTIKSMIKNMENFRDTKNCVEDNVDEKKLQMNKTKLKIMFYFQYI